MEWTAILNPSSEPGINGVALTELPETTLDEDETIPGNELDTLAVTNQTLADSGLDGDQRPDIEGVALQQPGQQPEDFEDNSTTNLDPLAVNDDPWSESNLNPSSEPGINGVALTELPETTLDED